MHRTTATRASGTVIDVRMNLGVNLYVMNYAREAVDVPALRNPRTDRNVQTYRALFVVTFNCRQVLDDTDTLPGHRFIYALKRYLSFNLRMDS